MRVVSEIVFKLLWINHAAGAVDVSLPRNKLEEC